MPGNAAEKKTDTGRTGLPEAGQDENSARDFQVCGFYARFTESGLDGCPK